MTGLTTRSAAIGVAIAITAAALLVYLPPLSLLAKDSGVFAYAGRLLLRGGVPYRDFWDHKPPGVYVIDALALALGGNGPWSLWAVSTIAALIAAVLATLVLHDAFGRGWGLLLGLLHATALVDPHVYQAGNMTEIYGLVLQWAALWWLMCTSPSLRPLFLAGTATGAAVLCKPTTCAIAIAAALDLLIARAGSRPRTPALAAFAAGVLWLPALAVVWLGAAGALAAAWDCVITYNQAYAASDLGGAVLHAVVASFKKDPINLLVVLTAFSLPLRSPASASRLARLALIALPFELICLAVQNRFFGHYYMTMLPVLSVRAGVCVSALGTRVRVVRQHRRAVAALVIVFVLARLAIHLWHFHRDQEPVRAWQSAAVATIQAHTRPTDFVLVWGAEMSLNFLADRRTPSVYGYAYPLVMRGYTTDAMWRRFLADLNRNAPVVIVDVADGTTVPRIGDLKAGAGALDASPATRQQLQSFLGHYVHDSNQGDLVLWEWISRFPAAPTP